MNEHQTSIGPESHSDVKCTGSLYELAILIKSLLQSLEKLSSSSLLSSLILLLWGRGFRNSSIYFGPSRSIFITVHGGVGVSSLLWGVSILYFGLLLLHIPQYAFNLVIITKMIPEVITVKKRIITALSTMISVVLFTGRCGVAIIAVDS